MRQCTVSYEEVISLENILAAWRKFSTGKKKQEDVASVAMRLMDKLFELHHDLRSLEYAHGSYQAFVVNDPKRRDIHKSSVKDRIVHHLLYRALYHYFDASFIQHSYSCRIGKGTHRALDCFRTFGRSVSRNNTRTCWVLKCDIRKFFASINHEVLKKILAQHIVDTRVLALCSNVIDSFETKRGSGVGLPLGNLTSQLFVNVYMNEFDQFVKHHLKAKHYIRYADDFVVLSNDKEWLASLLPHFRSFLMERLRLTLHPDKISIRTLASGIDFLGWIHFPYHRVMRGSTKRRALRRIAEVNGKEATVQSYLGLMSHGNMYRVRKEIKSVFLKEADTAE